MTIEETRSLMLTEDELFNLYRQAKQAGEVQELYLLEGDHRDGITVYIWPWSAFGEFNADETRGSELSDEAGDLLPQCAGMYAVYGEGYHGLHYLGWACFRTKADADRWESATLGHEEEMP